MWYSRTIMNLIFLAIFVRRSFCTVVTSNVEVLLETLSIDCGAETERQPQPNIWRTDDAFIEAGLNANVSTTTSPEELNTLRYFPKGHKNCYNLPLKTNYKYLLRAGFNYGNYDQRNWGHLFDIYINGQFWEEIFSRNDPTYVEIIYPNYRDNVELCLVRGLDKLDVPYISSIEATLLPNEFYRLMDNHTILKLVSRERFGGDRDIGRPSEYADDSFNRIWKLRYAVDSRNVSWSIVEPGLSSTTENNPPNAVLADGVIPNENFTDSLYIWYELPSYRQPVYLVLYFNEPNNRTTVNSTRKFQVYVDGHNWGLVDVPNNGSGKVVTLYPVSVMGWVNVTLAPAEGSTLPPIINALEIFTTSDLTSNGGGGHSLWHRFAVLVAALHVFGVWFCSCDF